MADFPKTRVSLILRLASAKDIQAWQEFTEIYAPVLYRLALAKGLQSADAEDVTQDILFAVARAAERFEPDADRARFRTWLGCIARNLIADFYAGRTKRPVSQVISDSWLRSLGRDDLVHDPLEAEPAFELEHRRALFHAAVGRVRVRVAESSWRAFEMTAIEQQPAEQVARQLGLRLGNVYVLRSRIMNMLRAEVDRMQENEFRHSSESLGCAEKSERSDE